MKLADKLLMAMAGAGAAPPPEDPPTVNTGSYGDVTEGEATLYGQVTDIGSATVTAYGHCWSESSNPDVNDDHTDFGSTNSSVNIISQISNLKAGTTYHYRAYATNQYGTSYGSDLTFTTEEAQSTHIKTFFYTGDGVAGRRFDFPGINLSTSGDGFLIVRKLSGSSGNNWMFLAASGSEGYDLSYPEPHEACGYCIQTMGDGYCIVGNHINVNAAGEKYSMIVANGITFSGQRYFWGKLHPDGDSTTRTHGLGMTPNVFWIKADNDTLAPLYNDTGYWVPEDTHVYMGSTAPNDNASTWWLNTPPTSTQFTVNATMRIASALFGVRSGVTAYGAFSATGSPITLYCGFAPKLVIVKEVDGTADWYWMTDTMETADYYHHGTPSNPSSYSDIADFTGTGCILKGSMFTSGTNFFWFAIG